MRTLFLLLSFLVLGAHELRASELAASPEAIRLPPAGVAAPDAALESVAGQATRLSTVLDGRPALLVFYRGGWCPYCSLQLAELRHLVPDLAAAGIQLVAVSPDSPESLRRSLDATPLEYTLVSDSRAELTRAFGIGFRVDADTRAKYREYGIDLEQASGGQTHHILPVPAVFLIDAQGRIQFAYANPDYRTRVPLRLVRAAVDALSAGETGRPLRP